MCFGALFVYATRLFLGTVGCACVCAVGMIRVCTYVCGVVEEGEQYAYSSESLGVDKLCVYASCVCV